MPLDPGNAWCTRLASVAECVANAAHAEEGLRAVATAAWQIFKAQTVAIVLLDESQENVRIKLSRGLSARFVDRFEGPLGSGLLAEVILGGMPLSIPDREAHVKACEEVRLEHDFGSAIAVGIAINRRPLGCLYCDHREPGHFGGNDLVLLESLGHLAALAIEKARMQDDLARLAIEDSVTGLNTYGYFYRRLSQEIARALRYEDSVGVLLLELMNLRYVRDVFGNEGTLAVMRDMAQAIQENTRGVDFATRSRANQAMICLVRPREGGLEIAAERILKVALSRPAVYPVDADSPGGEGQSDETTACVNLQICAAGALAPQHGSDAASIIPNVQKALRVARRLGSGHFVMAQD
ncbi:MAG: GAF domain-containing protein [Planctomycetes bacterium]|nr:GAF domain-containing protein [Planctomycetota bacterium]